MPFRAATRQPPLPLPAAVLCARVALHLHPMVSPCAAMSSASPGMARFISCPQRRSADERGRMRSLHAAQELGFDWSIAQRPLPFQSVLARVVATGHVAVAQPWLAVQRESGAAHCLFLGRLLLLPLSSLLLVLTGLTVPVTERLSIKERLSATLSVCIASSRQSRVRSALLVGCSWASRKYPVLPSRVL